MRSQLCVAALVLLLAVAAEARSLNADVTVANCKTYGMVNGKKTCVACTDNHVLVPGGLDCQSATAGCRSYGWVGGKYTCVACHDNRPLTPGGKSCGSASGSRHGL